MRPLRWLRRGVTVVSLGVTGAALAVTARHLIETPQPLESALGGEGRIDRKHGGDIYYNVSGPTEAPPMVLLHDFYPGASNYEYRHVFPRCAEQFRVYAPDWLGWGMSEHPAVAYTGEFYASMLEGFLRDVVAQPAHVIAHGRAANIAVRAASDDADLFASLVLVSPYAQAGIELEPKLGQALARTAQRTSLGLVPYALLSTRPVLRLTMNARTLGTAVEGEEQQALDHLYASAHQFGGQHALLALLTGELDLPLQNALALLEPPVLLVASDMDPEHTPQDMEDMAILNPHADLEIIQDAGAAVFEDQPAAFAERVLTWVRSNPTRHSLQEEDLLPDLELADGDLEDEGGVVLSIEMLEGDGGVESVTDIELSTTPPTEEAELAATQAEVTETSAPETTPAAEVADAAPAAAASASLEPAAPAESAAPSVTAEAAEPAEGPSEAREAASLADEAAAQAADVVPLTESATDDAALATRNETTDGQSAPTASEASAEAAALTQAEAVASVPPETEADAAPAEQQATGTQIATSAVPETPAALGNEHAEEQPPRVIPVTSAEPEAKPSGSTAVEAPVETPAPAARPQQRTSTQATQAGRETTPKSAPRKASGGGASRSSRAGGKGHGTEGAHGGHSGKGRRSRGGKQ